MLKTAGSSEILASKAFKANSGKIVRVSSNARADKVLKNLSKSKKSKNTKFKISTRTNIGATRKSFFLTLGTKKTYNHLRQAFIIAPILQYFDLEYYI